MGGLSPFVCLLFASPSKRSLDTVDKTHMYVIQDLLNGVKDGASSEDILSVFETWNGCDREIPRIDCFKFFLALRKCFDSCFEKNFTSLFFAFARKGIDLSPLPTLLYEIYTFFSHPGANNGDVCRSFKTSGLEKNIECCDRSLQGGFFWLDLVGRK